MHDHGARDLRARSVELVHAVSAIIIYTLWNTFLASTITCSRLSPAVSSLYSSYINFISCKVDG